MLESRGKCTPGWEVAEERERRGYRLRRAGGGAGATRTRARGVERGRRIQNDCWGCKTWRQGPGEPVIAQKGNGIKPDPQAVETLLSCEEDRRSQNWHQRQESSPPETPNRTEDILGRTSLQRACGPALAPPTMGCGGKKG